MGNTSLTVIVFSFLSLFFFLIKLTAVLTGMSNGIYNGLFFKLLLWFFYKEQANSQTLTFASVLRERETLL